MDEKHADLRGVNHVSMCLGGGGGQKQERAE